MGQHRDENFITVYAASRAQKMGNNFPVCDAVWEWHFIVSEFFLLFIIDVHGRFEEFLCFQVESLNVYKMT